MKERVKRDLLSAILVFGGMIAGFIVVYSSFESYAGKPWGDDVFLYIGVAAIGVPLGGTIGRLLDAVRHNRRRAFMIIIGMPLVAFGLCAALYFFAGFGFNKDGILFMTLAALVGSAVGGTLAKRIWAARNKKTS